MTPERTIPIQPTPYTPMKKLLAYHSFVSLLYTLGALSLWLLYKADINFLQDSLMFGVVFILIPLTTMGLHIFIVYDERKRMIAGIFMNKGDYRRLYLDNRGPVNITIGEKINIPVYPFAFFSMLAPGRHVMEMRRVTTYDPNTGGVACHDLVITHSAAAVTEEWLRCA